VGHKTTPTAAAGKLLHIEKGMGWDVEAGCTGSATIIHGDWNRGAEVGRGLDSDRDVQQLGSLVP
jgi:hypothetical protein